MVRSQLETAIVQSEQVEKNQGQNDDGHRTRFAPSATLLCCSLAGV